MTYNPAITLPQGNSNTTLSGGTLRTMGAGVVDIILYRVAGAAIVMNIRPLDAQEPPIETDTPFNVLVKSIDGLRLKRPAPVVIEAIADDEFIATSTETGIAISGESATEALHSLRISLAELFDLYRNEPKLGPVPDHQLRVLEEYFGKEGR